MTMTKSLALLLFISALSFAQPFERICPDGIVDRENFNNEPYSYVCEDPDCGGDCNWVTTKISQKNSHVTFSFPTPSATLSEESKQQFRVLVRPTGSVSPPQPALVRIYVYENGNQLGFGPNTVVAAEGVFIIEWSSSFLSDPTGAGVECRVVGTRNGLSGINIDVGAVEWNAYIE